LRYFIDDRRLLRQRDVIFIQIDLFMLSIDKSFNRRFFQDGYRLY